MAEQIWRQAWEKWCEDPYFDEETREELKGLEGDSQEIQDRFYKDLEFGTGGLRGVLGAGTNRMNIYTVRKATQGLANYILRCGGDNKKVAIAFDSRHMSQEFADEAARCLAANGIRACKFESLRPTPELSFALRYLECKAGIVITASHNPAKYNGYKVYWEDGAQITAPVDREIMEEVRKVTDCSSVKTMTAQEAGDKGLYTVIGEEVDRAYREEVKKQTLCPQFITQAADQMKIVYTPLHGTGNLPVRRILEEQGFCHVFVVKEQERPDGDFPTVPSPNPEDKRAFKLALELAEQEQADLVLATDPDADRLGIYARDRKTGEYREFTGNMSGMVILEYILSRKKALGALESTDTVVTTIVSTNMAKAAAESYGISYRETLTGFKYIGEQIKLIEKEGKHRFLFGFEESYGCLAGTYARDKDACVAVMLLCEAAAYCHCQDITLCDYIDQIYEKYGFYKETLWTREFQGAHGLAQMKGLMAESRKNPMKKAGELQVLAVRDYQNGIRTSLEDGKQESTGLPVSDVIYYELEGDCWFAMRPSGTEPKLKYYAGVKGNTAEEAEEKLRKLKDFISGN